VRGFGYISAMDKRYQVFVSSTFQDLKDERQEIIQALLELDCIPAGMELFPAANEDQWTLIKKVIDDCDYYIVIIGGRYGSLGPEGVSYTEMEYRYALERGIPTIGFLHRNPGSIAADLSEKDPIGQERLLAFRGTVEKKMCRYWETPADLGSQVSRSLVKLIKNSPAIGWIRTDQVGEKESAEILRLRKKIEELETGIQAVRENAPAGSESLAHGDDLFEIDYTFLAEQRMAGGVDYFNRKRLRYNDTFRATWNHIFSVIAPLMIDEAGDGKLQLGLNAFVRDRNIDHLLPNIKYEGFDLANFEIKENSFQTIKVQLRALGLIIKSQRPRSVKDTATYWSLTPYGDTVMTRLRAIPKGAGQPS